MAEYPIDVDTALRAFPRQNYVQVKSHIQDVLSRIHSLRLVQGTTGNADVTFVGTIPVQIQNVTYNIPVRIILGVQYPAAPPKMWVLPTDSMYIATSRHVDGSGLVYHPYLHSWNLGSKLLDFLLLMMTIFGREPPVYAKTQRSAHSQPSPAQTHYGDANSADKDEEEKIMEQIKRQSVVELLTQRVKTRIVEMSEMEKLQRDYRTLIEGKVLLDEIFTNIKRDESRLIQAISVLQEKSTQLKSTIETMEKSEGAPIDEEVKATAPLYAQILQTVAEENAIQDTIYQLSRALNHNNISLDEYLKLTRNLSREQFMKRALILKARKESGLR